MEEDHSYQNKFIPRELKDCPECGKPRISFGWCKECETIAMKENFPYWTSENKCSNATKPVITWNGFRLRNSKWLNILEAKDSVLFIQLFRWKVLDGFGMMVRKSGLQ